MKLNRFIISSFILLFSSVNALHCITLPAEATLTFAVFWSNQMLTSLREKGASAALPFPLSPSFTHYLPCSDGYTALKIAIDRKQASVVAYLRSIGAPQ